MSSSTTSTAERFAHIAKCNKNFKRARDTSSDEDSYSSCSLHSHDTTEEEKVAKKAKRAAIVAVETASVAAAFPCPKVARVISANSDPHSFGLGFVHPEDAHKYGPGPVADIKVPKKDIADVPAVVSCHSKEMIEYLSWVPNWCWVGNDKDSKWERKCADCNQLPLPNYGCVCGRHGYACGQLRCQGEYGCMCFGDPCSVTGVNSEFCYCEEHWADHPDDDDDEEDEVASKTASETETAVDSDEE